MNRADRGVTLVELLVVVAVMGIVMPPLVGALTIGWRTTDTTVATLADNRNRALTPSLFTRDVQAANQVDATASDPTCTTAGDTLVVRFRWTTTDAGGTTVSRAASWVQVGGADPTLQRRYCADGAAVASSVVLAHGIVGTPSVTCRDGAGGAVSCGSAVRVDLAVTDAGGVFSATGRRRTP